jgi:hypothetical protein
MDCNIWLRCWRYGGGRDLLADGEGPMKARFDRRKRMSTPQKGRRKVDLLSGLAFLDRRSEDVRALVIAELERGNIQRQRSFRFPENSDHTPRLEPSPLRKPLDGIGDRGRYRLAGEAGRLSSPIVTPHAVRVYAREFPRGSLHSGRARRLRASPGSWHRKQPFGPRSSHGFRRDILGHTRGNSLDLMPGIRVDDRAHRQKHH